MESHQFHPVLVCTLGDAHGVLPDKPRVFKATIVNMVVPASILEDQSTAIWVDAHQHLGLGVGARVSVSVHVYRRAFCVIELRSVAASYTLRAQLLLKERIELDSAPASFEHIERQNRVLVVSTAPRAAINLPCPARTERSSATIGEANPNSLMSAHSCSI